MNFRSLNGLRLSVRKNRCQIEKHEKTSEVVQITQLATRHNKICVSERNTFECFKLTKIP